MTARMMIWQLTIVLVLMMVSLGIPDLFTLKFHSMFSSTLTIMHATIGTFQTGMFIIATVLNLVLVPGDKISIF